MKSTHYETVGTGTVNRRRFLSTALCACAIVLTGFLHMQLAASLSESLTNSKTEWTHSLIIN